MWATRSRPSPSRSARGAPLTARLLRGRPVADAIWQDVERRVAVLRDGGAPPPRLAVVQVGDDPATGSYVRQIARTFERHGLDVTLPTADQADEAGVVALLDALAADSGITGILLTLPLPPGIRQDVVIAHLLPSTDVEGIHPANAGALAQGRPRIVPSTPLAGLEILKAYGVELRGKVAVVVGRSTIVGRPLGQLLLLDDATVVTCHTKTVDLAEWTRRADVLCLAAGRAGLVDGSMVRPGATVVDFGTNVVGDKLLGDADFESVSEVAGAITPVPGGVGPVTTSLLARNLVDLAERHVARG